MGTRQDPAVPTTVLRALRVPAELDAQIEAERSKSGENRTKAMVRRMAANGSGKPEVDWAEFDRQVQIALRRTPQVHRALKAAREAMGL